MISAVIGALVWVNHAGTWGTVLRGLNSTRVEMWSIAIKPRTFVFSHYFLGVVVAIFEIVRDFGHNK